MRKIMLSFVLLLFGFAPALAQKADVEALHNELRAVKQQSVDAVNSGHLDDLFKVISPNIRFTAMNNELVRGVDGVKEYGQRMVTGANSILSKMTLTADPDDLSILYADNQVAIATGTSLASMTLRTGNSFDLPLRWSATLEHSSGKWLIASLHFSANVFDNPVMSAEVAIWKWVALGVRSGLPHRRLPRRTTAETERVNACGSAPLGSPFAPSPGTSSPIPRN